MAHSVYEQIVLIRLGQDVMTTTDPSQQVIYAVDVNFGRLGIGAYRSDQLLLEPVPSFSREAERVAYMYVKETK